MTEKTKATIAASGGLANDDAGLLVDYIHAATDPVEVLDLDAFRPLVLAAKAAHDRMWSWNPSKQAQTSCDCDWCDLPESVQRWAGGKS